jgi:hypothetical protein
MWRTENRPRYNRDKLRCPSDLTEAEQQQLIKPLVPPAKRGGRKRTVNMRNVVNGVMYMLSTDCQWRHKRLTGRVEVDDAGHGPQVERVGVRVMPRNK